MAEFNFPVTFEADDPAEAQATYKLLADALDDVHEAGEAPGLFVGEVVSPSDRLEQTVYRLTLADLDAYAGREVTDEEAERFSGAIGNSTITDTISTVLGSITDDGEADDDDEDGEDDPDSE